MRLCQEVGRRCLGFLGMKGEVSPPKYCFCEKYAKRTRKGMFGLSIVTVKV